MQSNKSLYSYLLSIGIHAILAIIFLFISFNQEVEVDEYVTIGFGAYGKMTSSKSKIKKDEEKKEEKKVEKKEKVELPKIKNVDENNNVAPKTKDKAEEKKEKKKKEEPVEEEFVENEGFESGDFTLDWGGKKIRKLYDYVIPNYPSGVSKEIDVKLRFHIKPDGTVGRIIPLIKADTRLELAAMNALKKWRFEPLPSNSKRKEQKVIITFPFRLR